MSFARWFRNLFVAGPRTSKPPYEPHPLNVPGHVYVGNGCCMACGIWELDAPDHFSWEDYSGGGGHCYVSKQPATDAEFEKVLGAIESQELDCIRVRQCPARWRQLMNERGLGEYADG